MNSFEFAESQSFDSGGSFGVSSKFFRICAVDSSFIASSAN